MRVGVSHSVPQGGALRTIIGTTEALAKRMDVAVFELHRGGAPIPGWGRDVQIVRRSVAPPAGPPGVRALGFQLRWAAAHRQMAVDVATSHRDLLLAHPCQITQGPELLLHCEIPVVYFAHEVRRRTFEPGYAAEPGRGRGRELVRRLAERMVDLRPARIDRRAVSVADAVLANSDFTRRNFEACYGRSATVCYLGIDLKSFTPSRQQRRAGHVLVVGGLEPFKGTDRLVTAMGLLPEGERQRIIVTGQRQSTRFRDELGARAHASGVDVRVIEDASEDQLIELYRSASVTAAVAVREPFGLTTVESLACGTPVLAVREGGYPEVIVDGVNGVVVDPSPADIARGLRRMRSRSWGSSDLRDSVDPWFGFGAAADRIADQLELVADRG